MQTMRLFIDVARHRSFSEAAKLHGITQSAASQRIGQLEKKLGVELFDRSVRPLALTGAGEIYQQGCQDMLDRYSRLEQKIVGMRDDPAGRVRVAAIYSAGIDLLERIREDFVKEHPRVDVDVRYKRPDEVYEAVREHTCDLGIVSYPQRWRQVGVMPLRDERMVVVTQPGHRLTRRALVRPSDLADEKLVTFENDLPVGRRIRRYLREHNVEPVIEQEFDNIDTIKHAVALTGYVAILPWRTVAHEIETGMLASIDLRPQLVRPIGIIFRPMQRGGEAFAPAAKLFVDYLVEHGRLAVETPQRGATA